MISYQGQPLILVVTQAIQVIVEILVIQERMEHAVWMVETMVRQVEIMLGIRVDQQVRQHMVEPVIIK